jgi:hypothetical protein
MEAQQARNNRYILGAEVLGNRRCLKTSKSGLVKNSTKSKTTILSTSLEKSPSHPIRNMDECQNKITRAIAAKISRCHINIKALRNRGFLACNTIPNNFLDP